MSDDEDGVRPVKLDTAPTLEAVRARCFITKGQFEDVTFRCDPTSLYLLPRNPPQDGSAVESWRRPDEYGRGRPSLFRGDSAASSSDVVQGDLGDCWLLGAFSILATRPDLLERLFVEKDELLGYYRVRFYRFGRWEEVVVDDRFPCLGGGEPAYGTCRDPLEVWVPVLEKAYAKMMGCYENLNGGSVSSALVDLTGGSADKLTWSEGRGDDPDTLWAAIMRNKAEGHLMGCSKVNAAAEVEEDDGAGILVNHAYGLLDAVETHRGSRLVRVRNPWGEGEWRGAFSDGSAEWDEDLLAELGYTFGDDGTFWMSIEDFARHFNKLFVCRLYDDHVGEMWARSMHVSRWNTALSGGSLAHPETWLQNPQFRLASVDGSKPVRVFLQLQQRDIRQDGLFDFQSAIGLYVLRNDGNEGNRKEECEDPAAEVALSTDPFSFSREISAEFVIPPRRDDDASDDASDRGNNGDDAYGSSEYIVMPATYDPGQRGYFVLTVHSSAPIEIEPYDDHNTVPLEEPEEGEEGEEEEEEEEEEELDEGEDGYDSDGNRVRRRSIDSDIVRAREARKLQKLINRKLPQAPRLPEPELEEVLDRLRDRGEKYEDRSFRADDTSVVRSLRFRPAGAEPGGDASHLSVAMWRRPKEILTPMPQEKTTGEGGENDPEGDNNNGEDGSRDGGDGGRGSDEESSESAPRRGGKRGGKADAKRGSKKKGRRGRADTESESESEGYGSGSGSGDGSAAEEEIVIPDPLLWPEDDEEGNPVPVSDVTQGDLGDCYLIGALSVLATRPELLRSLVVMSDFELGVHQVRFFRFGEWVTVTVDDRLPCNPDGQLKYARSKGANEFWVAIVEKAYAKLNGGYANIEGGSLASTLSELTGGVSEKRNLDDPANRERLEDGTLWEELQALREGGFLLGCADTKGTNDATRRDATGHGGGGADGNGNGDEDEPEGGILSRHAYALLDMRDTHGNQLVRLRNPWGELEWTGPFADHSKDWTKKILRDLEYEFKEDGTFWMPFEDFLSHFDRLYVCRIYDTEEVDDDGVGWSVRRVPGDWDFKYSGGSLRYRETWLRNPQYHLSTTEKHTKLFVHLEQRDVRADGLTEFPEAIGFYVLRNINRRPPPPPRDPDADPEDEEEEEEIDEDELPEVKRREMLSGPQDVVYQSEFVHARETSIEIVIEPGEDYILMPATFEPGHCGDYLFTVYTRQPAYTIRLLPGDAAPVKPAVEKRLVHALEAKWTIGKAGGCPSNDTWARNPQFLVRFPGFFPEGRHGDDPEHPGRVPVSIDLEQLDAEGHRHEVGSPALHSCGWVLLRTRRPEKAREFRKRDVRDVCEYRESPLLTVDTHLDAGVNYLLVPSTLQPGRLGRFRLTVLCHEPVSIERVDKEELVDTTTRGPRRAAFALGPGDYPVVEVDRSAQDGSADVMQRTLLLLKPDALSLGSAEVIEAVLADQPSMLVVDRLLAELSVEQAREFAPQESQESVEFLASGPVLALVLMGPQAVPRVKQLCGNPDPAEVPELSPDGSEPPATLRAMFGTDRVRNAVHCSETEPQARRDIKFFFPDMVCEPLPEVVDAQKFLRQSVFPALIEGLTELSKTKPEDPKAWLGQWLIDNNPTRPNVNEPVRAQLAKAVSGGNSAGALPYTVEEPDH